MTDLQPGIEGSAETIVAEAMTASATGSGDVPVFATSEVLAVAERAACRALEGRLEPDETSVGSWVELSHLAPTPPGATVRATARLVQIAGRRLTFELSVSDDAGEVATGRHGRAIVPRRSFLETAARRLRR